MGNRGFCRISLFVEQITTWGAACLEANPLAAPLSREEREQGKCDRKKIKELERYLLRKDNALAEAAALIILRKKSQAIWGEREDD